MMSTIEQRYFNHTNKNGPMWNGSRCWVWVGYCRRYPIMRVGGGHRVSVHRWAYEHFVGVIPMGHHVDHKCTNILCSNPQHLEAVPPAVNNARSTSPSAINAIKTHCPKGHPYNVGNMYVQIRGNSMFRNCIQCATDRAYARYHGNEIERRRKCNEYYANKRAAGWTRPKGVWTPPTDLSVELSRLDASGPGVV